MDFLSLSPSLFSTVSLAGFGTATPTANPLVKLRTHSWDLVGAQPSSRRHLPSSNPSYARSSRVLVQLGCHTQARPTAEGGATSTAFVTPVSLVLLSFRRKKLFLVIRGSVICDCLKVEED